MKAFNYCCLIFFFFAWASVSAQTFHPGILYLNDGSSLNGELSYDAFKNLMQFRTNGKPQTFTTSQFSGFVLGSEEFKVMTDFEDKARKAVYWDYYKDARATIYAKIEQRMKTTSGYITPSGIKPTVGEIFSAQEFYVLNAQKDWMKYQGTKKELKKGLEQIFGAIYPAIEAYMKDNKLDITEIDSLVKALEAVSK